MKTHHVTTLYHKTSWKLTKHICKIGLFDLVLFDYIYFPVGIVVVNVLVSWLEIWRHFITR